MIQVRDNVNSGKNFNLKKNSPIKQMLSNCSCANYDIWHVV